MVVSLFSWRFHFCNVINYIFGFCCIARILLSYSDSMCGSKLPCVDGYPASFCILHCLQDTITDFLWLKKNSFNCSSFIFQFTFMLPQFLPPFCFEVTSSLEVLQSLYFTSTNPDLLVVKHSFVIIITLAVVSSIKYWLNSNLSLVHELLIERGTRRGCWNSKINNFW